MCFCFKTCSIMSDAGTATKAFNSVRASLLSELSATTMRLVPMSRPTAPDFGKGTSTLFAGIWFFSSMTFLLFGCRPEIQASGCGWSFGCYVDERGLTLWRVRLLERAARLGLIGRSITELACMLHLLAIAFAHLLA